ncbi:MAG: glycosyl hydrolase [Bacteroidales bacterium]|nr:glycosyl hydrolase [Bacteroidales bacterium]
MIRKIILGSAVCLLLTNLLLVISCSSGGDESPVGEPPQLVSSDPANGETDVAEGITAITLRFNMNVTLAPSSLITLNGQPVTNLWRGQEGELKMTVPPLLPGTDYTLLVPAQTVKGPTGLSNPSEIRITFKTHPPVPPLEKLSPQAEKLLQFLKQQEGKKTLSGTMAHVAWNINEAEWVHHHTGNWPAINCFDYIHLHASPANWIDYGNITVAEEWWNSGGVVSASWHWNVPANSGVEGKYSFYWGSAPDETRFDVKKIDDPDSDEYKRMIADIDKLSGYLKLLKEKNIPVLWRPLHEAAGNNGAYPGGEAWFWWGGGGPEPYKKLWRLMFDRMTHHHGLDNLLWVWTSQVTDPDWYPGDDYVDMVGRDIYNETGVAKVTNEFTTLQQRYPGKPVALSECGNVATISAQWNTGARWLWFMPWYEYDRTLDPGSDAFQLKTHEHASIAWWEDALAQPYVLTRDELPDLK